MAVVLLVRRDAEGDLRLGVAATSAMVRAHTGLAGALKRPRPGMVIQRRALGRAPDG
ncbi:hypothetical protein AB5J72_03160 [Streptomyces sp. CG1]|uniref:hypothetical protein n=1 Tax=Streptomyces sp. CG1 TaxID=1287523 RepID=UPI0034E19F98